MRRVIKRFGLARPGGQACVLAYSDMEEYLTQQVS